MYFNISKNLFVCALMLMVSITANAQLKGINNAEIIPAGEAWAKNSVNTVIFRRNSLVTYKDTQYIAYYDEDKNVVLGKRNINSKDWELIVTPYKGDATDAHKSISIMIDGDGYLHMSWDLHGGPFNYCKSISPGSLELTPKFNMTGFKEKHVTYPEFYRLANGNLLFLYRDGGSGNGSLMLNIYDIKTKKWKMIQDGWINGDVSTNHDMCYAKSDDGGVTWKKSTDEKYNLPITAATAEYALKIPQKSELINSTAIAVDENNSPYIVNYWKTTYDTELWKDKKILNLFVQNVEQGDGETTKELTGQKAAVLKWKIK
ncbi:BNR repeat-containing protein [Pedobacter sp. CG_S7]|uniref:BNR repeat-containing protein n=1 Tax=Pedobacter sp. CG_S7 TaxID=3143930 RepID=UPI00339860C9